MQAKTSVAALLLGAVLAGHGVWLLTGGRFTGPITLAIFVAMIVLTVTVARLRWYNATFRVLIGLELIASVADRFGLFGEPGADGVSWGSFAEFEDYVRELLPSWLDSTATVAGIAATGLELGIGVLLVAGLYRPIVAALGAVLLGGFALAMATSVGLGETASYAVVAQAAALLLLAVHYRTTVPNIDSPAPAVAVRT